MIWFSVFSVLVDLVVWFCQFVVFAGLGVVFGLLLFCVWFVFGVLLSFHVVLRCLLPGSA